MPSWNPGLSRWMPAGAAAYCRERLIRLKPGLPISSSVPTTMLHLNDRPSGALYAPFRRERLIRLKPGLPISDVRSDRRRVHCMHLEWCITGHAIAWRARCRPHHAQPGTATPSLRNRPSLRPSWSSFV